MNAIEEFNSKELVYEFLPIIREKFNSNEPIVSIIIDCYYGLDLVKQSIQSVLNQDYQNVEIVLVDNGAKGNVSKYLHDIYTRHNNIALIKFKENQFSWVDTEMTVVNCWNAALLNCKGDIVSHLSYDDMLSYDCCSRMAKLFTDNDNCVTTGPLPVSIDINGKVNEEFSERLRLANKRTKYIVGKELALDFIQGSPNKYFGAPGGVLFTKRSLLLKSGGFDRSDDITQIIKCAIHGESGFDSEAKLYWRHHEGQLNKIAKKKGLIWLNLLKNTVRSERIIETWSDLFSIEQVELLKKYIKNNELSEGLTLAIESLRTKNYSGFFYTLKNVFKEAHPSIFIYVLWFSILEVLKMFYEKIFSSVRNT
jgi:glycosyltransferase involved in cell wall biosynthesis